MLPRVFQAYEDWLKAENDRKVKALQEERRSKALQLRKSKAVDYFDARTKNKLALMPGPHRLERGLHRLESGPHNLERGLHRLESGPHNLERGPHRVESGAPIT